MTALFLAISTKPVSVNVNNWPEGPFGLSNAWIVGITMGLAAAALVAAIIGAIYAIYAYAATKRDLNISQTNLAIAQRHPVLVASFRVQGQATGIGGAFLLREITLNDALLAVTIANSEEGERRCDAFLVEIRVPNDALSLPAAGVQLEQGLRFFLSSRVITNQPLFPSGPAVKVEFEVPFEYVTAEKEVEIEYRLKDDFITSPPKGYHRAKVTLPRVAPSMSAAPRDAAEIVLKQQALSKHLLSSEFGLRQYRSALDDLNALGRVPSSLRNVKAQELANTFHL